MVRSSKPLLPVKPRSMRLCSYSARITCRLNFGRCSRDFCRPLLSWLLPILTLGLIGFAGWRIYASMSGRGSFELENHNGKQDVGFDDVAGVDEARAELTETIEFLRNPERFSRLGGRVPRGILLYGPPGTGKTLLARAAAKEAGVAFLVASGSSFQEKFAGLGAARVRHLFAKGRKLSPCIIFIDEIDALGRQRGRGGDSASADQDQTLNQLLVEMDGFDQSSCGCCDRFNQPA